MQRYNSCNLSTREVVERGKLWAKDQPGPCSETLKKYQPPPILANRVRWLKLPLGKTQKLSRAEQMGLVRILSFLSEWYIFKLKNSKNFLHRASVKLITTATVEIWREAKKGAPGVNQVNFGDFLEQGTVYDEFQEWIGAVWVTGWERIHRQHWGSKAWCAQENSRIAGTQGQKRGMGNPKRQSQTKQWETDRLMRF